MSSFMLTVPFLELSIPPVALPRGGQGGIKLSAPCGQWSMKSPGGSRILRPLDASVTGQLPAAGPENSTRIGGRGCDSVAGTVSPRDRRVPAAVGLFITYPPLYGLYGLSA